VGFGEGFRAGLTSRRLGIGGLSTTASGSKAENRQWRSRAEQELGGGISFRRRCCRDGDEEPHRRTRECVTARVAAVSQSFACAVGLGRVTRP
jgi:hypothetical protein